MRILAAIPHYFDPQRGSSHGSLRSDSAARIAGLTAAIAGLKQFEQHAFLLGLGSGPTNAVEQAHHARVDVILCTTGARHLLAQIPILVNECTHRATGAEPRFLGFECQRALRERAGEYDYYCYLEDDLIIRDLWLFAKLAWFTRLAGRHALLQPNRYETDAHSKVQKLYVDGNLAPEVTASLQDVNGAPEVSGEFLGSPLSFRRALNPHAGCYFLHAEQFAHWVRQPHFGRPDASFIGPLESAATLGVMRTFHVYKPAAPNMAFLEIQHSGAEILTAVEKATARS